MGVRNYNSVNGVIRGHYDHGVPNSEVMYVRDGLGSVVATVDARGNVLNQYHYKPWGEMWQKTGSAPDPRFLWAGSWGYRAYGNKWVSHYVRARHYSTPDAAWTTVDPLWPVERAYGYVEGRVTHWIDRDGTSGSGPCLAAAWSHGAFSDPRRSRGSRFTDCQRGLAAIDVARRKAGLAPHCANTLDICLSCQSVTELPYDCTAAAHAADCRLSADLRLLGLAAGFLDTPFGTGKNFKQKACMTACKAAWLSLAGSGWTKFAQATCQAMCHALRTKGGCDRLWNFCFSRYGNEKNRLQACLQFYLGVCFGD